MGNLTLFSYEIGPPQHLTETEETVPQSSAEHPRGALTRKPLPSWGSTSATALHTFYKVLIQSGEYTYTSPGSNTTILTFNIMPSSLAVFL